MPVIRTTIFSASVTPRRNNDQLLSFSSILSSKYPQGRLNQKIDLNKSGHADRNTTISLHSIAHPHARKSTMNDVWAIGTDPVDEKQIITPQQKLPTVNPHQLTRLIPYLIAPLILLVGAGIAAALLGTVFNHPSSTTNAETIVTTTTTTTTFTSATTTTETTRTTSTTITSTLTSTSTTSSSSTSTTTTTTTVTTTTETTTTTVTTTTTTGGCYFGGDNINLIDGGRRPIHRLQAGDRIWTLAKDGQQIVEDEIVLMMHAEAETSIYFYTFTTIEGHSISLSGSHYLVVVANGQKSMSFLRASKVTLNHQIVMFNRTVTLANIVYAPRVGFYAPLTLTGNLLVNNISTSIFVDSYRLSHEELQGVMCPVRLYYRFIRWIFGKHYNPFWTTKTHGLHPLIAYLVAHQKLIRLLVHFSPDPKSLILLITIGYLIQRKGLMHSLVSLLIFFVKK